MAGTPNDGSASVLLPNVTTSQARIKVKASNNVFFDISNGNFSITPEPGNIDYDLAIVSVQGLNPGPCESVLDPKVTVFNVEQLRPSRPSACPCRSTEEPRRWSIGQGRSGSGEGVDVAFCESGPCVALADGNHVADAMVQLTGASDENASNDGFTTSFETSSGAESTWTIVTDNYPGETTWSVTNEAGATVWSGGPYASSGTTYTESLCLPYGCYSLTVNDSYGDGICCAYGQGSFVLTSGGQTLAAGGEFGPSTTLDFCLDSPAILGCTDPTAVNYNPQATQDDGSCVEAVSGCTNPIACNYDPSANVDDGSCTFAEEFYDCGAECLIDSDGDGVCDPLEVVGCQDAEACTTKRPRTPGNASSPIQDSIATARPCAWKT